jgi:hypothetical protein
LIARTLVDGRCVSLGDADHRRRNARIVDEAVQATEPFQSSIDHPLDVGLIGHVRADETNADPLLERTAFLLTAPDDHDLSPFRDKGLGDPFPDAACAPGHDRDLAVQRAHVSLQSGGNAFADRLASCRGDERVKRFL